MRVEPPTPENESRRGWRAVIQSPWVISIEALPAAERERVRERFVRLDAARSTRGSGLGLEITDSLSLGVGVIVGDGVMVGEGVIVGILDTGFSFRVDREDLGRYPAKQRKVMAFHYGAIRCLAREFDLDETETLAVFVRFVNTYFNMPVPETGSISERLQGFQEDPGERRYLETGEDVFRRWHEQGERRAPLELGEMLRA